MGRGGGIAARTRQGLMGNKGRKRHHKRADTEDAVRGQRGNKETDRRVRERVPFEWIRIRNRDRLVDCSDQ